MINLSKPDITKKEINSVLKVLKTPYLALGPKLKEFEKKLAAYIGSKYAIAVNSGTSGLHLLVRALGIKKGDEVITTPFSFIASANCILYEGAKPIFVDIDPLTLNIDPQKIEKAITKRTKAIITVDIFGHPADWDSILKIAKKYKLKIIEDSCEALGAEYKGRKCGNFGDAAVFAFYPNKQITTGEGGIIVTDNKKISEMCQSMHNQGRKVKDGKWLEHIRLGFNYRMSDIQAAIGITQLERIKEIIKKREKVAKMYNKKLSNLEKKGLIKLPYVATWAKISWFVYVIQLTKNFTRRDRDQIMKKLQKTGIQCNNYFQCIHLQPFYRRLFNHKSGDFPIAESVSGKTIALPFYNNLTEKEIKYIVKNLEMILLKKGN
ncbi:MAG: DegT/DnrJ/EryC1/StrS family aminotransferase [Patescibacteria group bacterium]|nr:DegT/DnrJ/EryC1/StrS family aminotransferase [Patescibacteria group bacterium]MDD5164187.1 DegT/DnrJ/EryC1/StrS family aminotransferase [Patescibacteria group bacterium]MDD5534479.1 DegT/DnrJ/EryC1/StrS family aminotransferase [Patescibacteria group bacterium]